MGLFWRNMLFLVLLEIAFITYIFFLISESSFIAICKNRKTTVESFQDSIENGNESLLFADLKKDLSLTSDPILFYVLLILASITYFVKDVRGFINMNAEIFNYILKLQEKRSAQFNNTGNAINNLDHIYEQLFDAIHNKLSFVKRRFYLVSLKVIIVSIYLLIATETIIRDKTTLTEPDYLQILEFSFMIIGPYATSFFFNPNRNNFLSEINKRDIEDAFMLLQSV